MRSIISVLLLFAALNAKGQIKRAELTASGLTCSMCSKAIYKALEKVKFVEKVDVDIDKSTYSLTFSKGVKIEFDELKKAVTNAGFNIAELKFTADFQDVRVSNDSHVAINGLQFHFINVDEKVLQGELTLKILDKNFITSAEHKKYGQFTKMKCYETGIIENCCPKEKVKPGRIYHVTI